MLAEYSPLDTKQVEEKREREADAGGAEPMVGVRRWPTNQNAEVIQLVPIQGVC